jgi:hypothetical protein
LGDALDVGWTTAVREVVLLNDGALPPFAHVVEIWAVGNAILCGARLELRSSSACGTDSLGPGGRKLATTKPCEALRDRYG